MLSALTQLLLFQLAGEMLSRLLGLPIPGPVIGMVLLFFFLRIRGAPGPDLKATSQTILQNFALLFVPVGTGIMVHRQRLADEWLSLSVALLISTVVTLMVTAFVMRFCLTRQGQQQ